jgi:hypothetical protein
MDYKNKYIKYKNKYINLKKLYGGSISTSIYLVASKEVNRHHFELVVPDSPHQLLYINKLLQDRENDNLKNLNDKSESMYSQAKQDSFDSTDFVNLYDAIGALYICTTKINDLWNILANHVGFNIAIFNGDKTLFRQINPSKFIVGLNILFGCSTKENAEELNNKTNNSKGIYFIGIDGYKHNYGSSIYACGPNSLKMTTQEFIREYESYSEEYPIIRIIKIFFSKFKYCKEETCRNCNVISLDKIQQKLLKLKPKIEKKESFTGKDHYFNTDYQDNCNVVKCIPDLEFESYIKQKIYAIDTAEKLEKELKIAASQKKKEWDATFRILTTNSNTNEETTEEDITKEYKNYFFKDEDLEEILGDIPTLDRINNYLVTPNGNYRIFIIKKKNNKDKYFKFEVNNNENESYINYFTKGYVPADENGSVLPDELF